MPLAHYLDDTFFNGSIYEFHYLVYSSSLLAVVEMNITDVQVLGNPPMWTPINISVSAMNHFMEAFEYYFELLASGPVMAHSA